MIWHQNGKAAVREDGTIQLISLYFFNCKWIKYLILLTLFIYRCLHRTRACLKKNRFFFSWCHEYGLRFFVTDVNPPFKRAALGGPLGAAQTLNLAFPLSWVRRPDFPQWLVRMRCANWAAPGIWVYLPPIQFYLSDSFLCSYTLLILSHGSGPDPVEKSGNKDTLSCQVGFPAHNLSSQRCSCPVRERCCKLLCRENRCSYAALPWVNISEGSGVE